MEYKTEQEAFWSGKFGDSYVERNKCTNEHLASSTALFARILSRTCGIKTMIEFGCNVGMNLKAVKMLFPDIRQSAIEINHKAVSILKEDDFFHGQLEIFEQSILEYQPVKTCDLVLIAGVLIHINPDELQNVYEKLYHSSQKYICISEYYNPVPVEVNYRGHEGRLFKRDFAGEMMDKYPDLRLADYGFQYHRDYNFPIDDGTWFLLEKVK